MAFAMAGGQVSLAAAFPPALMTITVSALLGLVVWRLCIRLPWPEEFRIGFYAVHLVAALVYGLVWMIATIALESLLTRPMWSVLRTPRAITWALTGVWLLGSGARGDYLPPVSDLDVTVDSTWQPTDDVSVTATYPYSISLLGMVVKSGRLSSTTTERVE